MGSRYIPLDELPGRMHELPVRTEEILVVGPAGVRSEAVRFLRHGGRRARSVTDWRHVLLNPPLRLWEPNEFLTEFLADRPPGRALDLGCGTGRDAVAMAAHGWNVVAVDNLSDAIEKGRQLATRYLPGPDMRNIQWVQADLDARYDPGENFDLVTMFFYLNRGLLQRVSRWIAPGGTMLIECLTNVHREHMGRSAKPGLTLEPDELPDLLRGWTIEHVSEAWRIDRHTIRVRARR